MKTAMVLCFTHGILIAALLLSTGSNSKLVAENIVLRNDLNESRAGNTRLAAMIKRQPAVPEELSEPVSPPELAAYHDQQFKQHAIDRAVRYQQEQGQAYRDWIVTQQSLALKSTEMQAEIQQREQQHQELMMQLRQPLRIDVNEQRNIWIDADLNVYPYRY